MPITIDLINIICHTCYNGSTIRKLKPSYECEDYEFYSIDQITITVAKR